MAERAAPTKACVSKTILVEGPPGSGKTEWLTDATRFLLRALPQHERVLALTFTNKSSANLHQRLNWNAGTRNSRVEVHNFHGLSERLLRSHGNLVGVNGDYLRPSDEVTLSSLAHKHLGLDTNQTNQAVQELRQMKSVIFRSSSDRETAMAALSPAAFALEEYRIANSIITYDDLLQYAVEMLHDPRLASIYNSRFGALILDEYQDMTALQCELALLSTQPTRVIAGDECQGIYAFAGADVGHIRTRIESIADEQHQLTTSHRSSECVLTAVNAVRREMARPSITVSGGVKWPSVGHASQSLHVDELAESTFIIQSIRDILQKAPSTNIAVLASQAWRLGSIDEALRNTDIPLSSSVDDEASGRAIRSMIETIRSIDRRFSCAEVLEMFFEESHGVPRETLNMLSEKVSALKALDANAILFLDARLAELESRSHFPDIGVHLTTVHKAKGREFDWVFLVGLEHGVLPHRNAIGNDRELSEQLRVLHVALSRARFGLVVTRVSSWDNSKKSASEWWGLLNLPFTDGFRITEGVELYHAWRKELEHIESAKTK